MKTIQNFPSIIVAQGLTIIGLSILAVAPQPVLSAEKVKLIYGPFHGRISVKSLETYSKTGEITDDFRLYAKFIDQKTLTQMRYWLNNRFTCDRVQLYRFAHSPQGEAFLKELGTAITTHNQHNGFYAIRSALIEAADNPGQSDGWTIIEAMYYFPTEDLQINTLDLFKLQRFWSASSPNSSEVLEVFAPDASH